jgi:hypothetical protein
MMRKRSKTMPRRSLRFACVGAAVVGALFCLGIVAAAPPSARPALAADNPTVTISNAGFNPCPSQSNAIQIQAGTGLPFKNTTNKDVTVTFTFTLSGRTQTTTVAAGTTVSIVPDFATQFTFSAPGFNQNCVVEVSEALPTPTNTAAGTQIPGSVPSTGGGPIASVGGSRWMLWGALLTMLALVGLGGALLARRRRLH